MKIAVMAIILSALAYGGPTGAQDLPPDILADQYLLEAATAIEADDLQAALRAFGKIEALDVKPPLEFLYFYGKFLVESGSALDDVLKGQSLLKQYVLNIEKDSEHYTSTLKLLSQAESNLVDISRRLKQKEEARKQEQARKEEERKTRKCRNECSDYADNTESEDVYHSCHWHQDEEEEKDCRKWKHQCRRRCATYNGDFERASRFDVSY